MHTQPPHSRLTVASDTCWSQMPFHPWDHALFRLNPAACPTSPWWSGWGFWGGLGPGQSPPQPAMAVSAGLHSSSHRLVVKRI